MNDRTSDARAIGASQPPRLAFAVEKGCKAPLDGDLLWRFMTLEHFADLVLHDELHFARVDGFHDRHEILWPANLQRQMQRINELIGRQGYSIRDDREEWIKRCFACCWTMSSSEPAHMWSRVGAYDVAIVTQYQRLRQGLLGSPLPLSCGKIEYIEDRFASPESYSLSIGAFLKRTILAKEAEFRIVHYDLDDAKPAVNRRIPIDAEQLIVRIVVGPKVSKERARLLRTLLSLVKPKMVGLLEDSELASEPSLLETTEQQQEFDRAQAEEWSRLKEEIMKFLRNVEREAADGAQPKTESTHGSE